MKLLKVITILLLASPACLCAKDVYNVAFIGNTMNAAVTTALNASKMVWLQFNAAHKDEEINAVYLGEASPDTADRLKSIPNLTAVEGCFSDNDERLIQAYRPVPFISYSSSGITESPAAGLHNLFRMCPGETEQAGELARFMAYVLQSRSFAVVYQEGDPEYLQTARAFENSVKNSKRELLYFRGVEKVRTDFEAVLWRLRDMKAGVIFYAGTLEQAEALAKQALEMKLGSIFASTDTINRQSFIEETKQAAEGTLATSVSPPFEKMKVFARVVKDYRKQLGPPDVHMPYAYDAANMLVSYAELNTKPAGGLTQYLKETTYNGILGKVRFDESGYNAGARTYFYVVRNKAFWLRKTNDERVYER